MPFGSLDNLSAPSSTKRMASAGVRVSVTRRRPPAATACVTLTVLERPEVDDALLADVSVEENQWEPIALGH